MSKPDSSAKSAPAKPKKASRRFRTFRLAILLLLGALLSLTEPNVFRFVVRKLVTLEAWRHGVDLELKAIEGSLFEPLVLLDSRWRLENRTGTLTETSIDRAEARFDVSSLIHGTPERWFQSLTLAGVHTKITLPATISDPPEDLRLLWGLIKIPKIPWTPLPSRVEALNTELLVESQTGSLKLENTSFLASDREPGYLRMERITLKQPGFSHSFRDVHGTTALKDAEFTIADLVLEPGIEIQSCSAHLQNLAKGHLNLVLKIAAFGGKLHAQAQTLARKHPLTFEASGNFDKIEIAQLANFLGLSEAAGGTIKAGTFSFRGAPQQITEATATLWLEASNFQWESRQWDTLTFGAALMDHRIQVTKLDLLQGHNQLHLSGEMALPMPGTHWWLNEFTCDLSAKIDDMTELSALMLPEFRFAAGKALIDGSIRGRNKQFNGQLIVAGSHLKWRNAPIENLHAALKLNGNQCHISNLEIFNRGDYVRGSGSVNILGPTQYSGELRASVDDLATYAAILQKPIVPEPLAGRAIIEWSGEGSATGHNGKFLARLNKVRSLGRLASQLHPINIDMDGTYTQGSVQFSRFAVSDDESSLTANVGVGNNALSFQQIRLSHGSQLALEGDALLPLDVWKAWPNASLATLLRDDTVSQVNLKATGLDLRRASQLAGWNFPIVGTLNGSVEVSGAIGALNARGQLSLSKSRFPLGWHGDLLNDLEATISFDGNSLSFNQLTTKHQVGDLQLSGSILLKDVRNPELHLRLKSDRAQLPIFGLPTNSPKTAPAHESLAATRLTTALDLEITGSPRSPVFSGSARITELHLGQAPELASLWLNPKPLPPIFQTNNSFRFDIKCQTDGPIALANNPGKLSVDTQLVGAGANPHLKGTVVFTDVRASANAQPITVSSATLQFREYPTLDLAFTGSFYQFPYQGYLFGPLTSPIRWLIAPPPLTLNVLLSQLDTPTQPAPFQLPLPEIFAEEVDLPGWKPIETPPAEIPPPAVEQVEPTPPAPPAPDQPAKTDG